MTIERIQEVVCERFSLSLEELCSHKRSQNIVYPRQVAMYLSRELTDSSLPKIGKYFGDRDHTTVLHANTKIHEHDSRRPDCVQPCARVDRTHQTGAVNLWIRATSPGSLSNPHCSPQMRTHTAKTACSKRDAAVSPRSPTPLCTTKGFLKNMSNIEAQSTGGRLDGQLDIVVSRDELAQKLAVVGRGVSTRTAVQILGGILLRAAGSRKSSSRRPTWSSRSGHALDATGRRRRSSGRAGQAASSTCRGCCRKARSRSSTARRRTSCRSVRPGGVPAEHLQRRGLPASARIRRFADDTVDAASLLATIARRRPRGVTRRGAARPHGHPGPVRRGEADHGRDRLVPALVQGDTDRGRGAGARSDRAGSSARRGPPAGDCRQTRWSSVSRRTRCCSGSTARG